MAALGSLFGGIGGLVGGMYTAKADEALAEGEEQAAASYKYAEGLALQNVGITKLSTEIQKVQLGRKIAMTEGAMVAAEGAANVSGGSAGDLMRMSIQQGALAQTLVSTQGALQENAYKEQAAAYEGMSQAAQASANAARIAAKGAQIGGIFSLLGGIAGMFG